MSDWIEWNGGARPVEGDVRVEVSLRDGLTSVHACEARSYSWNHHGAGADILWYRVVKPDVSRQDHYTAHAIQPIEYIVANGLTFLSGNVVKYVTRYSLKGGVEDLKKARVYLDWLIEQEEIGTLTVHK